MKKWRTQNSLLNFDGKIATGVEVPDGNDL